MKIKFTLDLTGTAWHGFGHLHVAPSNCPSKLNDNEEVDSYLKSLGFHKEWPDWGWDLSFTKKQLAGGAILYPAMDVANQVIQELVRKGGLLQPKEPPYYSCDRGYSLRYGEMVYGIRAGSTPNYGYGCRGRSYLCTEYKWVSEVVLPWWRQ
jgi:hypothetical protein